MNSLIKKLAMKSYDTAFTKCKEVEHTVADTDTILSAFAMGAMHELTVKECIQKLIDNGYDDAANCLIKEMDNV